LRWVSGLVHRAAAAVAGLIPRSPYLILSASFIIVMGVGFALWALSVVLRGEAQILVLSSATIVLGLAAMGAPFAGITGLSRLEKIGYPITGVALIGMGISAVHIVRMARRSRQTETTDRG
jgi:hypothetical protein